MKLGTETPCRDNLLRDCFDAEATRLLGRALNDSEEFARRDGVDRLREMIEHHRNEFEKARRGPVSDAQLLQMLSRGELAKRANEGANLVRDVVLAVLLADEIPGAADVFDLRFCEKIDGWATRWHCDDLSVMDSLRHELSKKRPRSPESWIASYIGKVTMDGWLKWVMRSIASKRPKPQATDLESRQDDATVDPLDEYAKRDCTKRLEPVLKSIFDELDEHDRLVLQWSILDGKPQKELAERLGRHPGTVAKKKQGALDKLRGAFGTAARKLKMPQEAMRDCIELILARFTDADKHLVKFTRVPEPERKGPCKGNPT